MKNTVRTVMLAAILSGALAWISTQWIVAVTLRVVSGFFLFGAVYYGLVSRGAGKDDIAEFLGLFGRRLTRASSRDDQGDL